MNEHDPHPGDARDRDPAQEHGRDHAHGDPFHVHPTGELDESTLDPASRSMAEALRISFNILKFVVLLLILVFVVVGGYRNIEDNQVGVRFRFGAPIGERIEQPLNEWLLERLPTDAAALNNALSVDDVLAERTVRIPGAIGQTEVRFTAAGDADASKERTADQPRRFTMHVTYADGRKAERPVLVRRTEGQPAATVEGGRLLVDLLEPGLHFVLPAPIDEVVLVPTRPQLVNIEPSRRGADYDPAFWFTPREADIGKPLAEQQPQRGGLVPGRDGALITADKNLVHGRWSLEYRIDPTDAGRFVRNIGGESITDALRRAEAVVREAGESAILHVTARTPVGVFIAGNTDRDKIRAIAQAKLNAMEAGLTITRVLQDAGIPPLAVRDAFNAVNEAQTERARLIEEARQFAGSELQTVAGSAYDAMILAVDYYERARNLDDAARIDRGERVITNLLDGQRVDEALQPLTDEPAEWVDPQRLNQAMQPTTVQGAVTDVIKQATAERTNRVARLQAEADAFESQYAQYEGDPALRRIIVDRMWQDMMQQVFSQAEEVFHLPRDVTELRMDLPRNPDVRRNLEATAQQRMIEQGGNDDQ